MKKRTLTTENGKNKKVKISNKQRLYLLSVMSKMVKSQKTELIILHTKTEENKDMTVIVKGFYNFCYERQNDGNVKSRPYMGYMKDTINYRRINIANENERLRRYKRYKEGFVAHKDRFLYETGICIGSWFLLDTEDIDIATASYSINELEVHIDYEKKKFHIDSDKKTMPQLRIASFSYLVSTTEAEEMCPIAQVTPSLLKHRFYTKEDIKDEEIDIGEHPVKAIFLTVETTDFKKNLGNIKKFMFTTHSELPKDIDKDIIINRMAKESLIIQQFFKELNKVDIIVGHELFRQYCDTGIEYLLKRLLMNKVTKVKLGKIKLKQNINNVLWKRKNYRKKNVLDKELDHVDTSPNPFHLISAINVDEYAKKDCSYAIKSFEYIYEKETGERPIKLSNRAIANALSAIIMKNKLIQYGFDRANMALFVVITKELVQRALIMASLSSTHVDDMWNPKKTSHRVLSTIMREIAGDPPRYIIDMTEKLKQLIEKEYPITYIYTGGAVGNPTKKLAKCVLDLDFSAFYPSLIIENELDSTNILTEKPLDKSTKCRKVTVQDKSYIGKLGHKMKRTVDVYYAKNTGRTVVPAILKRLYDSRMKIKNSDDISALQSIEEKVLKLLMNCIYGVSGTKGYHIYNPALAESITMRGQSQLKKTMSYVTDHLTVNELSRVDYNNHLENKGDKDSCIEIIHYDTDGFSCIFKPELPTNVKLEVVGQSICDMVNESYSQSKLSVENVSKVKIFHNPKRRSAITMDGKVWQKGTWGSQVGIAPFCKQVYNTVEYLILTETCTVESLLRVLKKASNDLNEFNQMGYKKNLAFSSLIFNNKYNDKKNLYKVDKNKKDAMKALDHNVRQFDYPLRTIGDSIDYVYVQSTDKRVNESCSVESPQYMQSKINVAIYAQRLWEKIYDLLWEKIPMEHMKEVYQYKKDHNLFIIANNSSSGNDNKVKDIEDLMSTFTLKCQKCEQNPCNTFTHNSEGDLFSSMSCNNRSCDVWECLNHTKNQN